MLTLFQQGFEEKEEYALDMYARLRDLETSRHGMAPCRVFERCIRECDPHKADSEVKAYIARGFRREWSSSEGAGAHEGDEEAALAAAAGTAGAPTESVDPEELLSIDEFMFNLRRGVLKRSDPKALFAAGVRGAAAMSALAGGGGLLGALSSAAGGGAGSAKNTPR